MKITYIAAKNTEAKWGDKKSILARFDGLNIYTLNRWLKEMRENKKFRSGVINPTHKLVWINFETFEQFLHWKQRN